jgi:NADH-quinone oxidoreductase subunit B
MTLQRKIDGQKLTGPDRPRHLDANAPSEFPVPKFGAHDLEPAKNPNVWEPPAMQRTE